MINKIISFIFIPICIWMLKEIYKEIKRDYNISGNSDFLFKILWLFTIAYLTISFFTYAFLNASLVVKLKYW